MPVKEHLFTSAELHRGHKRLHADKALVQVQWTDAAARFDLHSAECVATAVAAPELPFLTDLPPRVLRLSPLECHFEGVAQHVGWSADRVVVDGWAYLRSLGITGRSADFRAWLVDERGERLDAVEIAPTTLPEANIWSRQPFAPYDGAGFTATLINGQLDIIGGDVLEGVMELVEPRLDIGLLSGVGEYAGHLPHREHTVVSG